MTLEEVALEEARHAVAAWRLNWNVTTVSARPDGEPGRRGYVHAWAPVREATMKEADRLAEEALLWKLAGKCGTSPSWPPTYWDAVRAGPVDEDLGAMIRDQAITPELYRRAAFRASEMMSEPEVERQVSLIALALLEVRTLDTSDLVVLLGA